MDQSGMYIGIFAMPYHNITNFCTSYLCCDSSMKHRTPRRIGKRGSAEEAAGREFLYSDDSDNEVLDIRKD